jgi:hypothetical protein
MIETNACEVNAIYTAGPGAERRTMLPITKRNIRTACWKALNALRSTVAKPVVVIAETVKNRQSIKAIVYVVLVAHKTTAASKGTCRSA